MTVLDAIPFAVYLLGPFLAAWWVARRYSVVWRFFWVGFPAFFISQLGVSIFSVGGALLAIGLGLSVSFWAAFLGAIGAGVCEEGCRYYAFRYLRRKCHQLSWNSGFMYAIGHSGLETILVGVGMLLAVLAVTFAPEQLSTETLEGLSAVGELSFLKASLLACERMMGGLIIHLAFTSLVVLALLRGQRSYLWAAIIWHAAHDMVFLQPAVQESLHGRDGLHAAVIGGLLLAYMGVVAVLRSRCDESSLSSASESVTGKG